MEVQKLTPEQWAEIAREAHLVVFGTDRPSSMDRIDFALVCSEAGTLKGYLTAKEMDAETVYWQFGGAFDGTRGTSYTIRGYLAFVAWTKERYKRIQTRIENDNIPMLHFAMKAGFRIVGMRCTQNSILLDLELICSS